MNNNLERLLTGPTYTQTYSLWGNSMYYDIKNLSPQNYSAKPSDVKAGSVDAKDPEPPDLQVPKTISRDTLVAEPGQKDVFTAENASNPNTYDWTKFYWQKATKKLHTTSESSSDSREDSGAESDSEVARGPRRRRAYARYRQMEILPGEPVKISKAANMMAKMGWQGGALGKAGDGIILPIAPNVAYANNKLGLGRSLDQCRAEMQRQGQIPYRGQTQPPIPTYRIQPQVLEQTQNTQKSRKQNRVKTQNIEIISPQTYDPQEWLMKKFLLRFEVNTLNLILDFVNNNSEIELLFDMKLKREERKRIHQIVNNMINNVHGKKPWFPIEPCHMDVVQMIRARNCYQLKTKSSGKEPYRQLCLYKTFAVEVYVVTPEDLNQADLDLSDTPHNSDSQGTDSSKKSDSSKNSDATKNSDQSKKSDATKLTDALKNSNVNKKSDSEENLEATKNSVAMKNSGVTKNLDSTKKSDVIKSLDLSQNTDPNVDEEVIETNPFMLSITRNLKKEKGGGSENTENLKENLEILMPSADILKYEISTLKVEDVKPEISTSKAPKKMSKTMLQIIELFKEFSEFGFYDEFKFLGPFTDDEFKEINKFYEEAKKYVNREKVSSSLKKCFEKLAFAVTEDCTGNKTIIKLKVRAGA